MDLSEFDVPALLRLQAAAVDELRLRKVVRTANNPIGDFTEWLVAKALGLHLAANSAAGYDAISPDGSRLQIKGRRVATVNGSRQLSAIRNLAGRDFDELVAVVYDQAFQVLEAIVVPHAVVAEFAVYRKHVNAHVLHVRGPLLQDPRVRSVRAELQAAMAPAPL